MRHFARGQTIPFSQTFYDSSGDVTSPTSVRVTISYPSSGFPYEGVMETTYVDLTENSTTLVWSGNWSTTAAYPGPVFYSVRSDDLTLNVAEGSFMLRGNSATLSITT